MRKRLTAALVLLIIAGFAVPSAARAQGTSWATPEHAERIVRGAIAHIKKVGKEKAFATFNNPKGSFAYRDLYITVYDLAGKCLAHGADASRIGKDLIDDKDEDGVFFIRERVNKAKAEGKGWQKYKFTNPATKKTEMKIAYFEVVEGVIVMCGAYVQSP